MKLMITISPVPRHDDGQISLKVKDSIRVIEIKDNEYAINFRTWYVELNSNNKIIHFELICCGEKITFEEEFKEVSVEDFKNKEINRIRSARKLDNEKICEDTKALSEVLDTLKDPINIIEVTLK